MHRKAPPKDREKKEKKERRRRKREKKTHKLHRRDFLARGFGLPCLHKPTLHAYSSASQRWSKKTMGKRRRRRRRRRRRGGGTDFSVGREKWILR